MNADLIAFVFLTIPQACSIFSPWMALHGLRYRTVRLTRKHRLDGSEATILGICGLVLAAISVPMAVVIWTGAIFDWL